LKPCPGAGFQVFRAYRLPELAAFFAPAFLIPGSLFLRQPEYPVGFAAGMNGGKSNFSDPCFRGCVSCAIAKVMAACDQSPLQRGKGGAFSEAKGISQGSTPGIVYLRRLPKFRSL